MFRKDDKVLLVNTGRLRNVNLKSKVRQIGTIHTAYPDDRYLIEFHDARLPSNPVFHARGCYLSAAQLLRGARLDIPKACSARLLEQL